MEVTNNIQISGNAQVLRPPHTVSPHATAQANLEAVKTVSTERGHAPNKEADKVSQKDLTEQVQLSVKEMNDQIKLANQ